MAYHHVEGARVSLGHFNLPLSDVEIELDGYNQAEAAHFMERFHLVFRKGGG